MGFFWWLTFFSGFFLVVGFSGLEIFFFFFGVLFACLVGWFGGFVCVC